MGALLVAYLAIPLGAFAYRVARSSNRGFGEPGLWAALGVSVEGATISLVLITLFGIPLAYALVRHPGRLSSIIGVVVQIPLALPPLMSGVLLLFLVGPYSTIGQYFDGRLTGSLAGVVIAQSFVSAPFLVVAARSAFATVDPTLRDVAATLGHRPLARFFRVDLRCAAPGVRAGMVLTWLRAFGEYGATLLIAYHPFSLPIYTDNQFVTGQLSTTEAPTLLALAIAAIVVLFGQARLPRRLRTRRPLPPPSPPPVRPPVQISFAVDSTHGTFRLCVAHDGTDSTGSTGSTDSTDSTDSADSTDGTAGRAARLAILGASGSGKSLTLRAIAGLGDRGTARVSRGGTDVSRTAPERRGIGYVPQGFGLIPGLDVRSQILFGVRADKARAAWWIATLHLGHLLDRYPDQLSGGQRQRVSLARALAADPSVLLLDEPFSALDAPVREQLRRELRRLQQQAGLSTVLVTHDPRDAAFLADDVIVIAEGQVLQYGEIRDVYRRPVSAEVGELVGVTNLCQGTVASAGRIQCGAFTFAADGRFEVDARVLWSVPPGSVIVDSASSAARADNAAAAYSAADAVVRDIIDLGSAVEILVDIVGGPQLRSQGRDDRDLRVGDPCRVRLDLAGVAVWQPPSGAALPLP